MKSMFIRVAWVLCVSVFCVPANAQLGGVAPAPAQPARIAPGAPEAAPAGAVVKPATGAPPVRLCTDKDVHGLWKLRRVFETPSGTWTADFKEYPYQFIWFAKRLGSAYFETKGATDFSSKQEAKDQLMNIGRVNPQQYVASDKGLIYFYRNGKAERSVYCGIVLENRSPYKKGNMVITPSQASGSQIFLLYGGTGLPNKSLGGSPQPGSVKRKAKE